MARLSYLLDIAGSGVKCRVDLILLSMCGFQLNKWLKQKF